MGASFATRQLHHANPRVTPHATPSVAALHSERVRLHFYDFARCTDGANACYGSQCLAVESDGPKRCYGQDSKRQAFFHRTSCNQIKEELKSNTEPARWANDMMIINEARIEFDD